MVMLTPSDMESSRDDRLRVVANRLAAELHVRKLKTTVLRLHDHKGNLTVWFSNYSKFLPGLVERLWADQGEVGVEVRVGPKGFLRGGASFFLDSPKTWELHE